MHSFHREAIRSVLTPSFALAFILLLLNCSEHSSNPSTPDVPRGLQLSLLSEVDIKIYQDGQLITSGAGYSAFIDEAPGRTTYGGDESNKIVTTSPSPDQTSPGGCGIGCAPSTVKYVDGFDDDTSPSGPGTTWNGVYVLSIGDGSALCEKTLSINHKDTDGDGFFDTTAADQTLRVDFDTPTNTCSIVHTADSLPIAATPLSVAITGPTTVGTNQGFTLAADVNGGFGQRRYAWKLAPTGGSSEDFLGINFNADSERQFSYATVGPRQFRLLVRDGNDAFLGGGNYALSSVFTVNVQNPDPNDAEAISHTLPGNINYLTYYATSVTMKNIGTATWSGSDYRLRQSNDENIWTPSSVDLNGATVEPNSSHTFSFNFTNSLPAECGTFEQNYWQMSGQATFFGDRNGRITTIKNCDDPPEFTWNSLLEWLSPSAAYAVTLPWWLSSQGEIVQILRQEDLPLPVEQLRADGQIVIRYLSSLSDRWDVDFSFHVRFDPNTFRVGSIVSGTRSQGHEVRLRALGPGEIVVEGTRIGSSGLEGEGIILEIPLVLQSGAEVPATLPLIELVVTR